MKYIAIGDIHGRYDLLLKLLFKIDEAYPEHTLLFLGDYIDRGPNAFQVVAKIKELCESGQAKAIMGNHEAMMLDYCRFGGGFSDHIWMWNGGSKTIHSYQEVTKQYNLTGFIRCAGEKGHLAWLRSLPLFYETDEIWASHAPISKTDGMAGKYRTEPDQCYWTYDPCGSIGLELEGSYNHGKLAVCGHIHRLKENVLLPRIYPHIIYADTGCGCAPWGPLTGIRIEDGIYIDYLQVTPEEKIEGVIG